MNQQFYSLPLAINNLMHKKQLSRCTLKHSVAQHLHLIITTSFGELTADKNFGCSIWEHDFDNITSAHKIKEWMLQSLLTSIQRYEKRLRDVRIELSIRQEEIFEPTLGCRIKKKLLINISGILLATSEKYCFHDTFFSGPLSFQII